MIWCPLLRTVVSLGVHYSGGAQNASITINITIILQLQIFFEVKFTFCSWKAGMHVSNPSFLNIECSFTSVSERNKKNIWIFTSRSVLFLWFSTLHNIHVHQNLRNNFPYIAKLKKYQWPYYSKIHLDQKKNHLVQEYFDLSNGH